MKRFKIIIILLMSVFACACQQKAVDPVDLYKGQTEAQVYYAGRQAMLKGKYPDAMQHYESLEARYPFGKYAKQVRLDSIYTYYKLDDVASALAAADRYIRLYPRDENVDYAYYMRGLVKFGENHGVFEHYFTVDFAKRDLTSLHEAFMDFNQLVRFYPHSRYAADARQRMIYIRNLFAKHLLQVATFYYDHKAYVAAANRANEIVEHYQQTPSVPKALALMVKSYRKLNLTQDANEAYHVLKMNFPNSKELQGL